MKMLSNKTLAQIGLGVFSAVLGSRFAGRWAGTLYLAAYTSLELSQRIIRTQKVLRTVARTDVHFERAQSVHRLFLLQGVATR